MSRQVDVSVQALVRTPSRREWDSKYTLENSDAASSILRLERWNSIKVSTANRAVQMDIATGTTVHHLKIRLDGELAFALHRSIGTLVTHLRVTPIAFVVLDGVRGSRLYFLLRVP